MDSQQESFRGKRTINADRVSWTTRTELRAYTVDSQQNPEDQSTLSPYLDQAKRGAAGNSHWLPSYHTTPESKPPSFIAYQLPRTPSEQGSQPGMLIPFCPHVSEHQRLALINAMAHPPVTRASLTELDLTSIFCNISLRSDINFESDLHFMPIGGKRAEQKRKEAEEYWLALAAELQIHHHTRLECSPARGERHFACESFTPRLSQMFTDLRELLEILVPDRDHISIAENLDVPFLMQQVQNGVLDIPRLAKWLAFLLKSHCAPMRDEWADHMTQQVEEGARSSDMVLLVRGIEKLFSVLEAMKLVTLLRTWFVEHSDLE